jgi:two-component system sensor histidine kinase VanS
MMKKMMKDRKRKYFGSLTHQLILISICLVTGTLLLCWFINTVFLEPYYVVNKQNTLLSGFETINEASENGSLDDSSFDVTFDNLCANGNITVMIISSDRTIVRSSVNDTQKMMLEFMNIIFGEKQNEVTVLMQSDNYIIQKQTDARLDSEFLVLYGTLSNGNLILMRTALESIRESVSLSNTFLAWVGVIAAIISAVVIVFVSRGITTPLLRLTDISKRMTELDFEAKYQPGSRYHNEVDELGEYMNVMSTISELKSANNQLQIDIDKKTQIDEMRKEFLSNVSHELKTPLALIRGYAEGLKECINDDAESRDFYCEVIMDEADKMNKMVKKLLTLNQLEFGNEVITMERFDLTELIQGVINASAILLNQNEITLNFSQQEPLFAWADEFKVEEVVTNYLSNAIHHAEGEKRIDIRCVKKDDKVRVSVFNTGKPIPEEDVDNIWIKFYKVDKARTREYGGSGIGLSIVQAIMDSFHQKCGVINHEDGVEFWFELETNNGNFFS